ncbi:MAG: hypothetical protein H6573_00055 [Lewinellaceae bacterium]|nr:hypothetical protein [Lewinellaceae bacterium]
MGSPWCALLAPTGAAPGTVLLPGAGRQGRVVLLVLPVGEASACNRVWRGALSCVRSRYRVPAPCRMNFAEECSSFGASSEVPKYQYNSRVRIGKPAPGRQSRDEVKSGAEWALGTLPPASKYAPSYSRGISLT